MIDLYLKFTDEAEAASVLYTFHPKVVGDDGVTVTEAYTTPNYANIDTIGVIYERTGGTDEEPVMTAIPGWHVNVRCTEIGLLAPFMVQTTTPYRVWA